MPRPSTHTPDSILDAACQAIGIWGRDATIQQISTLSGIPTGSIYHRFSSREELLISLWLRSIHRLHVSLTHAAQSTPDAHEALLAIALDMVNYCRTHPDEALAMTLYRQQNLLATCPDHLRNEIADLNREITATIESLAQQRFPTQITQILPANELVYVAVVQLPYGLVRPYVGGPVPAWLDQVVAVSVDATLRLGD